MTELDEKWLGIWLKVAIFAVVFGFIMIIYSDQEDHYQQKMELQQKIIERSCEEYDTAV